MPGRFLLSAMPSWAALLSVLFLIAVIVAPIRTIRKLGGLIGVLEDSEPSTVKPAKGIVVGMFLRTVLAVVGLLAILVVTLFGGRLPGWAGVLCALLLASTAARILAGESAARYLSPRAVARQIAQIGESIDEDVRWLRGE